MRHLSTKQRQIEIGERVKALREAQDLTQEDIARAIGIEDRQTIYKIETGKRALRSEELPKVAELLHTTVEYIVDGRGPRGDAMYGLGESAASFAQDSIPLVAYAQGERHVEGYTERPPSLRGVRHGYAVYVWDDRMEPRYSPGVLLYVNPSKPARPGRDVVVLRRAGLPTIAQLERLERESIVVRALKDGESTTIKRDDVSALHLVVGTDQDR
jgi:transcriptional regulator with XRE-family HTH domain